MDCHTRVRNKKQEKPGRPRAKQASVPAVTRASPASKRPWRRSVRTRGDATRARPTAAGTITVLIVRRPVVTRSASPARSPATHRSARSGCRAVMTETAYTPWGRRKKVRATTYADWAPSRPMARR